MYECFKVIRPASIINDKVDGIELRTLPDHSLITCCCTLEYLELQGGLKMQKDVMKKCVTKYDVSNIPVNVCNDYETASYLQALGTFEGNVKSQNDIDELYGDFCSTIKTAMSSTLSKKNIVIQYGVCNKRRRIRKPWWDDDLQVLWNNMCEAEKAWLKCKNEQKNNLKHIFVEKR